MAQLIYASPLSLDGYLARENYEWSAPGEEELAFITEIMRPVGLYLYGRKMFETMAVWETPDSLPSVTPASQEWARVWQAAVKIVYSRSLKSASTKKTRIEREFDVQAVRDLKAQLSSHISIGGPNLAAQAIRNGLVDEIHLFVVPKTLGGGIPVLPGNVTLDLVDERRFGKGWIYLRYRPRGGSV